MAAIGDGDEPLANPLHDFGSSYVLPGLIDGQTHAGSQFGFSRHRADNALGDCRRYHRDGGHAL